MIVPGPRLTRGGEAPGQGRGLRFGGSYRSLGSGAENRGAWAEREMSPELCQVGRRAPGWTPLVAGNFGLRDPLFLSEARSGRRLAGLCGSETDIAFLGKLVASVSGAGCTELGRRERKSSYDSGDGDSVARGAGLLLCATRVFKKNFPGKPLSETWRLEGTDLGALCQVLFVPGITSSDYCLTTSPSLPQSLSPPPALGRSWLCPPG